MNTTAILKHLQTMAPDAIGPHIEDLGGGVYALICMVGGMWRCVQFSAAGIYGAMYGSMYQAPKTDIELASELAKAVKL